MEHNLILILGAAIWSSVAAGMLGALIWAEVLDGREDRPVVATPPTVAVG